MWGLNSSEHAREFPHAQDGVAAADVVRSLFSFRSAAGSIMENPQVPRKAGSFQAC